MVVLRRAASTTSSSTGTSSSHSSSSVSTTTTTSSLTSSTLTVSSSAPNAQNTAVVEPSPVGPNKAIIAPAVVVPIVVFLAIGIGVLLMFRRQRALWRAAHPSANSSSNPSSKRSNGSVTMIGDTKPRLPPSPPADAPLPVTVAPPDRMQYPPIHLQHTKPLPPSPIGTPKTSSLHSKSATNLSRLTISSKLSNAIPSFRNSLRNLGKRRSTATTLPNTPSVPELPMSRRSEETEVVFVVPPSGENARASLHHTPLQTPNIVDDGFEVQSQRISVHSAEQDGGTGTNTDSGLRMSRFYPFLNIDPAAGYYTRDASPVPSSSASVRHMSFPPPYRHRPSESVHTTTSPEPVEKPDSPTPPRTSNKTVTKRYSIRSIISDFRKRSTVKSGLFGPRTPSFIQIRTSAPSSTTNSARTTASPLTLLAEMSTLFPPTAEEEVPQGSESSPGRQKAGGPRSPRSFMSFRSSSSTVVTAPAAPPGITTVLESTPESAPLRKPVSVASQATLTHSRTPSETPKADIQAAFDAVHSPPERQNSQNSTKSPRSLPSIPTNSTPSNDQSPPSRRKLPNPTTSPPPSEGRRARPPLPPIPGADGGDSDAPL